MNRNRSFRDFYYDHSDAFLALIILIVAGFLILWRINIIMEYPKTINITSNKTTTFGGATKPETSETEKVDAESSGSTKATWKGNKLAENFTVELKDKVTEKAIQTLVDAGLFTSDVDFKNVCKSTKRDSRSLKVGKYTFEKGMKKEDIIKRITNKKVK